MYGGSNYAGTTQKNPNAPHYYVGPSNEHVIGYETLMSLGVSALRWTNDSAYLQWTENGALVSLPGMESDKGGILVAVGGVAIREKAVRTVSHMLTFPATSES
jgi:hypothetical protein